MYWFEDELYRALETQAQVTLANAENALDELLTDWLEHPMADDEGNRKVMASIIQCVRYANEQPHNAGMLLGLSIRRLARVRAMDEALGTPSE